jgi:hypothetical protein
MYRNLFSTTLFEQDETKMFEKVSQVTKWLELPLEERPRLITGKSPAS